MCRPRASPVVVAAAVLALGAVATAAAQTQTAMVAAPDGTPLATDVHLPFAYGAGPWPAVLIRTPYGRGSAGTTCLLFTLAGWACVAQDTRGQGGSGGVDTVFRDDGRDGRATIGWIATQAWCNGRIATYGGSAEGITQYALAPAAPEQLVAMLSGAATPDIYRHAALQGGCLREALVVPWLAAQGSSDFLAEFTTHRLLDDWWQPYDFLKDVGEVRVPTLHLGGWYDVHQQGTLDAFAAYQHRGGPGAAGRQFLVMGPWTHATITQRSAGQLTYPENAAIDPLQLLDDWFSYWLDGAASGVESWAPARVYLMGAVGEAGAPGNHWLDLPDWPPATTPATLYLTGGGSLSPSRPVAASAELTADPSSPVPTLGGAELFPDLVVDGRSMGSGPYDQRPVEARADVLEFSSGVLREPLAVMGRLTAHIWVLPDTLDLDVSVRLTDVYPDGRSMLVADGIQRARMRCGDDRECFLTPGEPVEFSVDLWSTAIVFAPGHRIRVGVAGSNAPRFEVNRNDGRDLDAPGDGVVAHPEVLLGGVHGSRIELPVWRQPRRRLAGQR